jgi:hypothetical protein
MYPVLNTFSGEVNQKRVSNGKLRLDFSSREVSDIFLLSQRSRVLPALGKIHPMKARLRWKHV